MRAEWDVDRLDHSVVHSGKYGNQGRGRNWWVLLCVALTGLQLSLVYVKAECVVGRIGLTTTPNMSDWRQSDPAIATNSIFRS